MPFNSVLTDSQITDARAGGRAFYQYMLVCPNTIVFQAQINQSTFTTSFASVTYDNVTVGAYTDVKEGFTVYIGDTAGDIRSASFVGRVRANNSGTVATATTLNINWTSAALSDDQYIMVVKDVREWFRSPLPRTDGTDIQYKDYDHVYSGGLRPVIYDLQTAYVVVLDSNSNADVTLEPTGLAINQGASISSWSWDTDGGAFQAGSASSQDVTLRYTEAGHYMPRVTVTDSNSKTNWLSPHVFVVSAERSGNVVNMGFAGASISADLDTGYNATISAFDGVYNMADQTFCAIWWPDVRTPASGSNIVFTGRFQSDDSSEGVNERTRRQLEARFQLEGLASIMGRMKTYAFTFDNVASQTRWDQIKQNTPWRAVYYYLIEHTTICNTHSLSFSDTTTTYLTDRVNVQDSSVLDACSQILKAIVSNYEWAPTGEFRVSLVAWLQPTSTRDGLGTVADMAMADMQVDTSGGALYSLSSDYRQTVGRMTGYGAFFTEATGEYQAIQAVTPAVAPADGSESRTAPSQILTGNASLATAYAELGQRTADWFAAVNTPTTITVPLADGWWFLQPMHSLWYTWTIPAANNPRGLSYSTETRWTLQSITLDAELNTGRRRVQGVFRLETQGSGFQTVARVPAIPVGEEEIYNPPMPPPTYDSLPELDKGYPDPDNIDPNDPPPYDEPIPKGDKRPGEKKRQIEVYGADAAIGWRTTGVYKITGIGGVPSFEEFTPQELSSGFDIQDAKLDLFSSAGFVVANDGTDTEFFRTSNFGAVVYSKLTLPESMYSLIRLSGTEDAMYIYGSGVGWCHTFQFDIASGADPDTTYGAGGWTIGTNGVYSSGVGYEDTDAEIAPGTDYRRGVSLSKTLDSTHLTSIEVTYDYTKGTFSSGSFSALQVLTSDGGAGVLQLSITGSAVTNGAPRVDEWVGGADDTIQVQVLIFSSVRNSATYNGDVTLKSIKICGTGDNPFTSSGTVGGGAATSYSSDGGVSFQNAVVVGGAPSSNGAASALPVNDTLFAGDSSEVLDADAGGAYSSTTGGSNGEPVVIHGFGLSADDYLYGTSTALYSVVSGTDTDITPNDGADDGVPIGPNCLHMPYGNETHVVYIGDFNGTLKLCYSDDLGATWSFNTDIGANSTCVRIKQLEDTYAILVTDDDSLWFAFWDGGSGTLPSLTEYTSPGLDGVEFYYG